MDRSRRSVSCCNPFRKKKHSFTRKSDLMRKFRRITEAIRNDTTMSSRLPLNGYICNTCRLQLPKKSSENRSTVNAEVCVPNLEQLDDDLADYVDDTISLNLTDTAESDNDYDSGMGDQETICRLNRILELLEVSPIKHVDRRTYAAQKRKTDEIKGALNSQLQNVFENVEDNSKSDLQDLVDELK